MVFKHWWTAAELTGKVFEYKSAAHNWSKLVHRNKHSDVFYGFNWEQKSLFFYLFNLIEIHRKILHLARGGFFVCCSASPSFWKLFSEMMEVEDQSCI